MSLSAAWAICDHCASQVDLCACHHCADCGEWLAQEFHPIPACDCIATADTIPPEEIAAE